MAKDELELNDRQKRFVAEYLIDFNATQAAIRSGYSEETARQTGYENLTKPYIIAAVEEGKKQMFSILGISQERILREYARIGFFDIRRLFDENSRLKAVQDLTDDEAAALSAIDVDELWGTSADGKIQIGNTKKVKVWDKMKALDSLGKYFGEPAKKVELTGKDGQPIQTASKSNIDLSKLSTAAKMEILQLMRKDG